MRHFSRIILALALVAPALCLPAYSAANRDISATGSAPSGGPTGAEFRTDTDEEIVALWGAVNNYLSSVSGTNTITATATPTLTAYAAGNLFALEIGTTNTGPATLNVDSVGAKTIKRKDGAALTGGELVGGNYYILAYDGTDLRIVTETAVGALYRIDAGDLTSTAQYAPLSLGACQSIVLRFQMKPVTDGAIAWLHVSVDEGITLENGASDNRWMVQQLNSSNSSDTDADAADSEMQIAGDDGTGNGANEWVSGTLTLHGFNQDDQSLVDGIVTNTTTGGVTMNNSFSGVNLGTTKRNGLRLGFSTGNIAEGEAFTYCEIGF